MGRTKRNLVQTLTYNAGKKSEHLAISTLGLEEANMKAGANEAEVRSWLE